MAEKVTNEGEFKRLPLDGKLKPSPTNPRKFFDEGKLKELANSIKNQGVAQPILVRPVEVDGKFSYYEIIAGERRYRASIIAERTDIPAIIRNLTDAQAREIQIIENLQREDLHPMEEAEGFRQLMTDYGYSAEALAAQVSQSRSYIYAQLKLCSLGPEARKLFLENKLTPSLALLVSRISVPSLQAKAAKDLSDQYGNGPMSQRQAIAHIQRNFMLDLKNAQFNVDDDKLVPNAGACTSCPKRAGNQKGLSKDVDANYCTDPECFNKKRDAWKTIQIAKAEASGMKVIEGKAAKAIFPYSYSSASRDGYHEKKDTCWDDPKRRNYGQLAKAAGVSPVLVINPHTNILVELINDKDLEPHKKELGIQRASSNIDSKQAERQKKARLETQIRMRVFEALRDKVKEPTIEELRVLCLNTIDNVDYNSRKKFIGLLGWPTDLGEWSKKKELEKHICTLTEVQIHKVLFLVAIVPEVFVGTYSSDKGEMLFAAAKRNNIDVASMRSAQKAELKAKEDAKKKSAAKKAAASTKETTLPAAKKKAATKKAATPAVKETAGARAQKTATAKPAAGKGGSTSTPKALTPVDAWPFPKK